MEIRGTVTHSVLASLASSFNPPTVVAVAVHDFDSPLALGQHRGRHRDSVPQHAATVEGAPGTRLAGQGRDGGGRPGDVERRHCVEAHSLPDGMSLVRLSPSTEGQKRAPRAGESLKRLCVRLRPPICCVKVLAWGLSAWR